MRPVSLIVLIALLLGLSGTASATEDLLGYVNFGSSLPIHPAEFGEFWNTGFSLGAGIGVPITPELRAELTELHRTLGLAGHAFLFES